MRKQAFSLMSALLICACSGPKKNDERTQENEQHIRDSLNMVNMKKTLDSMNAASAATSSGIL